MFLHDDKPTTLQDGDSVAVDTKSHTIAFFRGNERLYSRFSGGDDKFYCPVLVGYLHSSAEPEKACWCLAKFVADLFGVGLSMKAIRNPSGERLQFTFIK